MSYRSSSCAIMPADCIAPPERSFDDEIDLGLPRPPTELPLRSCKRSHEHGRVPPATRAGANDRIVSGDTLYGLDQFEHARADPSTEIEGVGSALGHQHLARKQMRLREVAYMDIVPDCAPIRRRKVRSQNGERSVRPAR